MLFIGNIVWNCLKDAQNDSTTTPTTPPSVSPAFVKYREIHICATLPLYESLLVERLISRDQKKMLLWKYFTEKGFCENILQKKKLKIDTGEELRNANKTGDNNFEKCKYNIV